MTPNPILPPHPRPTTRLPCGTALVRTALLALVCALGLLAPGPLHAADNGGLGPLSVRNLFPPALPYLNYLPEAPTPIPDGAFRLTYQYALANTFINTQSPERKQTPAITQDEVDAGLTEDDFPATGYAAYIDIEAERHDFRLRWGLGDVLELGVSQSWVTLQGGGLDTTIESVEKNFNGYNPDRKHSDQDRYAYYLLRDGEFLYATKEEQHYLAQEPVLSAKWAVGEGGDVLPALTLNFTYKLPIDVPRNDPRRLVVSGNADYGYYVLISKAVGPVVGHFQLGGTQLGGSSNIIANNLNHKMFALEFRSTDASSWVLQTLTQTSILRERDIRTNRQDFLISRDTDVLVLGYKFDDGDTLFELGTVEDFNQNQNDTDIVVYLNLGWQW